MMKPTRLSIAQVLCRRLPPLFAMRIQSWIYSREQAYKDRYQFTTRSQTGSRFTGTTYDHHAYPFAALGYSHWRNWVIALAFCTPGDTIIELGGNVGTETIGFSDIVGKAGRVHVFEPLPINFKQLSDGLQFATYGNITLYPYAVGETCQKVYFSPPKREDSSGSGHVTETSQDGTIEVDCVNLDSMLDKIAAPKVIFLDIEGSEILALRGAAQMIARDKPALVLEASPRTLKRFGFTKKDLHDEVVQMGYQIFQMARLGFEPLTTAMLDIPRSQNWVCLHQSKAEGFHTLQKCLRQCALLPCIRGLNPLTLRQPRQAE